MEVGEEEKHHRTTVSSVYELPSPIPLSQTTAPAAADVAAVVEVDVAVVEFADPRKNGLLARDPSREKADVEDPFGGDDEEDVVAGEDDDDDDVGLVDADSFEVKRRNW